MCLAKPHVQFTDLPQEIRNYIVQLLHGCKKELASCAMAHRSLTWAAQKELHYSIYFDWRPGKSVEAEDMYTDPMIAAFVRRLELLCVPHPEDDEVSWNVLTRLINVESLVFSCRNYEGSWNYVTMKEHEPLRKTFLNVKTLEVSEDTFYNVEDFLFFLTAFPNVMTLKIEDVSFDAFVDVGFLPEELPGQVLEGAPCPKLRTLDVNFTIDGYCEGEDFEELVEKWMKPLAQTAEVGLTFKWRYIGQDTAQYFPLFVRALAPVLGSLQVALGDDASDVEDFGVQYCTALQSISFLSLCRSPRMTGSSVPRYNCDAWVLDFLSQAASPRLKEVTFEFWALCRDDLVSLDLKRLSEILTERRFAHTRAALSCSNKINAENILTVYGTAILPLLRVCSRWIC